MTKKKLPSFRGRVLLSFAVFQLILLCWLAAYSIIDQRTQCFQEAYHELEELRHHFSDNNRALESFLINGHRNESFYRTGQEPRINAFLASQQQLNDSLEQLSIRFDELGLIVIDSIDDLQFRTEQLIDQALELKHLYLKRGFIDHGQEGKMRRIAHALEDRALISRADILQLRRHEKDYLLRHQRVYVDRFENLLGTLIEGQSNDGFTENLLVEYGQSFQELVAYDLQIGIAGNGGIYTEIQLSIDNIEHQFSELSNLTKARISTLSRKFQIMLWVASAFAVLVALSSAIYFANALARDLTRLNAKMISLRRNRFALSEVSEMEKPKTKEVANLDHHFETLMKALDKTLKNLKHDRDQAKEISEYKSLFLANMSHEIRTPLNGVTGMAHMLRSTNLGDDQKQYMDVIEYSANHLLNLVNMILDYSKLDASSMQLERMEFDLSGDLNKLIKIFEIKAMEKGVKLNMDLQGDTSRMVVGDPLRLQQVLINLVDNALKFTNQGEVLLRVSETAKSEKAQRLRFEIIDTGIGIPNEKLDRLFSAFEQLDSSVTRQYGGTGLGLTISDQLVKLMGGELKVNSTAGHGSNFHFEIEFELGFKKQTYSSASANEIGEIPPMRVLVVEDNKVNQTVLAKMLERHEVEVLLANNGKEALDTFHREDLSLIFMDIQMPVMDGLEATRAIRKTDKYNSAPVPIVAITANAFEEDRKRAFEAGMNDFLSKPLRPLELNGVLAKYANPLRDVAIPA